MGTDRQAEVPDVPAVVWARDYFTAPWDRDTRAALDAWAHERGILVKPDLKTDLGAIPSTLVVELRSRDDVASAIVVRSTRKGETVYESEVLIGAEDLVDRLASLLDSAQIARGGTTQLLSTIPPTSGTLTVESENTQGLGRGNKMARSFSQENIADGVDGFLDRYLGSGSTDPIARPLDGTSTDADLGVRPLSVIDSLRDDPQRLAVAQMGVEGILAWIGEMIDVIYDPECIAALEADRSILSNLLRHPDPPIDLLVDHQDGALGPNFPTGGRVNASTEETRNQSQSARPQQMPFGRTPCAKPDVVPHLAFDASTDQCSQTSAATVLQ